MMKRQRTQDEIEAEMAKLRPKDADERIRKFQQWCIDTQPKTKKWPPKNWRFP